MQRHPTIVQKEMPQHHRTKPRPIIIVVLLHYRCQILLSLSNPALNNLQPPGGAGQNNTTTKTLPGLVNLAPGGGQNNTASPNQETTKTLPGLTQLVPEDKIMENLRITQADPSK